MSGEIVVTCYGARGSLPAPSREGFSTVVFGGNTTCYRVQAGPFDIILDFGSGAAVLGRDLLKEPPRERIALLSHYHWDHVQGLTFCAPMFIGGNTFRFHGVEPIGSETPRVDGEHLGATVERMLSAQQATPHFPVAHHSLPATRTYRSYSRLFSTEFHYQFVRKDTPMHYIAGPAITTGNLKLEENVVSIRTIPLNHPDGCLGYRITWMGKSIVFATDHEPARHAWSHLVRYGKDADLMILDGQYTESEISSFSQGFGHGTPSSCIDEAIACNAKKILIHHHDPFRDDATLASMESQHAGMAGHIEVAFAREGTKYIIPAGVDK